MTDHRVPSYNDIFNGVVVEIHFLVLSLDFSSIVDSGYRRTGQRKVSKAILRVNARTSLCNLHPVSKYFQRRYRRLQCKFQRHLRYSTLWKLITPSRNLLHAEHPPFLRPQYNRPHRPNSPKSPPFNTV